MNLKENFNLPNASRLNILWFVTGMFVFSSLVPSLLMKENVLRNPVEIFAIPLLSIIYLNSYSFRDVINKQIGNLSAWLFLVAAVMLSLIGMIHHPEMLSSPYSELRSLIVFFSVTVISKAAWRQNEEKLDFMIYSSLGLIIGDFLQIPLLGLASNPDVGKMQLSGMSAFIVAVLSYKRGWHALAFTGLVLMGLVCVFSGFRLNYIIAGATVLAIAGESINGDRKKRLMLFVFAAMFTLILLYESPRIYSYWTSSDNKQIHSVNRTEEFFSDGIDKQRYSSWLAPIERADAFLFPRGLGGWAYQHELTDSFLGKEYEIASSFDSSFFYISYHIGVVWAIIALALFIYHTALNFLRGGVLSIGAMASICLGVTLFLTSSPFFMIQRALPCGILLGIMLSHNNNRIIEIAKATN